MEEMVEVGDGLEKLVCCDSCLVVWFDRSNRSRDPGFVGPLGFGGERDI